VTVPPRTEQELLDQTIQLAKLQGWTVTHFRPARTRNGHRTAVQGHVGFVDFVAARKGRVLFRELKADKGKLTAEQLDWARQLTGNPRWCETRDAPVEYRLRLLYDVWRPADWQPLVVPTLTGKPAT
jgi:hypothetical protein